LRMWVRILNPFDKMQGQSNENRSEHRHAYRNNIWRLWSIKRSFLKLICAFTKLKKFAQHARKGITGQGIHVRMLCRTPRLNMSMTKRTYTAASFNMLLHGKQPNAWSSPHWIANSS
jgi:hypothetical protein